MSSELPPWQAAARVAAAAGALALGWRLDGAAGIVMAAPLAGLLLARVVVEGTAAALHALRARALRGVEGAYHAYRGIPIDVIEDGEGGRWLRVDDVRRILPALPRDETLRAIDPERIRVPDPRGELRIRADALLDWLSRSHAPESIRFRIWVERTVQPTPRHAARSGP